MTVHPDGAFASGRVQRVAVPGGDLVVEVAGNGPAIIFLHGWTLDRHQWRGQAALADRFTLVAVDRRGFGDSSAPPDLAEEPADVARIAAALGLERYHLVGLSQGGKVALAHAAGRPAGLDRLVVIGAPLDVQLAVTQESVPLPEMTVLARAGQMDAMRQVWLGHPLTAAALPVWGALSSMVARYEGRDLVQPGRPLPVTLDDVRRIAVPATALAGADDTPWRRAVAAAMAECGLASGLIAGGGHLAPMDAPEATNAAIRAALA